MATNNATTRTRPAPQRSATRRQAGLQRRVAELEAAVKSLHEQLAEDRHGRARLEHLLGLFQEPSLRKYDTLEEARAQLGKAVSITAEDLEYALAEDPD